jgi:hypothetical protein
LDEIKINDTIKLAQSINNVRLAGNKMGRLVISNKNEMGGGYFEEKGREDRN